MTKKDYGFLKKLLATFRLEAEEHIRSLSTGLIELEKSPRSPRQDELIETVFREAHSLKGAARSVNRSEIETVCQSLESVFAALKRKEMALSPELFDELHQAVDALGQLASTPEEEPSAEGKRAAADVALRLTDCLNGGRSQPAARPLSGVSSPESSTHSSGPASDLPSLSETMRISKSKLDSLLIQAEEMLAAKLTAGQRAAELRRMSAGMEIWKKEWAKIHPELSAMERMGKGNGSGGDSSGRDTPTLKLLEFLEWNSNFLKSHEHELLEITRAEEQDLHALGSRVDNLLEDMKKALTFPISSLLEIFPKFVRDLARDRDKEVELEIRGGEMEIDRRILEEMKDPLIHLVRNCIDHGIETRKERAAKKKPAAGKIKIIISPKNGNKAEIIISDDGSGVDVAKVRSAAVKMGLISQEEADRLDEAETLSLVFHSGLSTSPIITNISGRGLGLAIVREKVEKLGGMITLESHPDRGTHFRILLPLTLTTFRGLVVRTHENLFVFPSSSVDRVLRVKKEEIKTVENRETIQFNGHTLSLVSLGQVLELGTPRGGGRSPAPDYLPVVVAQAVNQRIGFGVDEVLAEQEVLVKGLGPQLRRVRHIAGATILGTGKVVLVLNVSDLMKSAVRGSGVAMPPAAVTPEFEPARRKRVLVVEDSITARTLLKNILEAAGYDVKTAVDGMDAFTILRTDEFDVVVSDVDMPRLNGFGLAGKIRQDKKLAEIPVILVTALESREDRERGIEVGANAYIVKSSFDQSNLLETIQRLI